MTDHLEPPDTVADMTQPPRELEERTNGGLGNLLDHLGELIANGEGHTPQADAIRRKIEAFDEQQSES